MGKQNTFYAQLDNEVVETLQHNKDCSIGIITCFTQLPGEVVWTLQHN